MLVSARGRRKTDMYHDRVTRKQARQILLKPFWSQTVGSNIDDLCGGGHGIDCF